MKVLALLAVALAVAAKHPRYDYNWETGRVPEYRVQHDKYEPGNEYQYMYDGQLMTGIPQTSEQHAATRIQAVVSVVFETAHKLRMQLRHVRVGSLNERIAEPRRVQPFSLFEPVDLQEEHVATLRLPIECEYKHGMIRDIVFDGEEQPWSANIKRGVLNMLQVNLRKERRTDTQDVLSGEEKETMQPFDAFTVQETTIEGDCETVYSVTSEPRNTRRYDDKLDVMNVTKSIDFEKCMKRPTIAYNMRLADICPTCEKAYNKENKMLKASTIIKQSMLATDKRDKCLIEQADVESMYTFVPFTEEGNVVQTYVTMRLVLKKTSSVENQLPRIESPVKSDSDMIYTPDWDIEKERFFMEGEGEFLGKSPYSPIADKMAFVKDLLQKCVHYMREGVEEEAPRQFTRLVKVLRTFTREEINDVLVRFVRKSPFSKEEAHKAKSLLIDAVALAGTKQAVTAIVDHVPHMHPLRAALALRKVAHTRTPTNDMLEAIYTLTRKDYCQENKMVCQSATLAIGTLLNGICNEQDRLAVAFKPHLPLAKQCNKHIKKQWIEKLFKKMEECESDYERIVILKAIGNAGIDVSIEPLEKIIKSVEYSPLVRVEAVLALRHLTTIMPRKVQRVLLPIYLRRSTPPQLRIACLHKLLATRPAKPIIDQLARNLKTEPSRQVAAYSFTLLNSLANSTNPCEKRVAEDIQLSLRHARVLPTAHWLRYSKLMKMGYFSQKYNRGIDLEINSIMSNYSYVPQMIGANVNLNAANLWMRNVLSMGLVQQNVDELVRDIARRAGHVLQTPIADLMDSSEEERVSPKFRKSLEKIMDDLSMEERRSDVEPMLAFYLRLANQDQAVLPISKELLADKWLNVLTSSSEEMGIEKMISRARKLLKDTTLPFNLQSATFATEISKKIPTTIGLPLLLSIKMPAVAQISGVLKVDFDEKSPLHKFNVHVQDVRPSFTITKVQKVESWSPIVNSALKVVSTIRVNTPFSGRVSVNAEKSQPEISIAYKPVSKPMDVLRMESRPITSTLVWPKSLKQWKEPEEKTIRGDEWTRESTIDHKFGGKSLGMEISTFGHWHKTPSKKVSTTPFCLFAGSNKLVINVRPGQQMPKEYRLTVNGRLFERLAKQSLGKQMNDFYKKSDEYLRSSSSEESYFTSSESNSKSSEGISKSSESISKSSESKSKSSESTESYESYEGRNPTRHQLRFVFDTVGSPIKRECVVEMSAKCGEEGKACTYAVDIVRVGEKEWKLNAQLHTLYPSIERMLKGGKYMARLDAKWGNERFVDLKLVGEQSRKMEKLVERVEKRSPVADYARTLPYGMLDQYKMDIDYDVEPVVRRQAEKALRLVKYLFYWDSRVESLEKNKQQIRALLNVDPVNRQYVNVSIEMPTERVRFEDIALPLPVGGIDVNGRRLRLTPKEKENACEVREEGVKTLSGVRYSSPLPECFTLLAKDCTRRSQFAVLAKRGAVKIISQHAKLIIEGQRCILNGEEKDCKQIGSVFEHGHEVMRVQAGEYVRVQLPEAGLRVYFDGEATNIKTSRYHAVCGLCGESTGDCELTTAEGECLTTRPRDIRRFVESYVQGECKLSKEDNYRIQSSEESSFESSSEEKENEQPRQMTRVIEQRGQVCFSKQPVRRCPRGMRPTQHQMQPTKVVYACIDRAEVKADELHRIANQRRIVDGVEELKASFTHEIYEPTTCRRI